MNSITVLRSSVHVWLPTTLATAVVQTLVVLEDPVPTDTAAFVLLALVSAVSLVAGLAIVARGLAIVAKNEPVTWRGALSGNASWLWSSILVVAGAASAVILPALAGAVILVGALILPIAAAGARNPWPAAGTRVRRRPLRSALAALIMIVLVGLAATGVLLLGFFVTGPLAAAITWLSLGTITVLVLAGGTVAVTRSAGRA